MTSFLLKSGSTTSLLLVPIFAFAQFGASFTVFFTNIISFINDVLVPLIFALALLLFLWGMYRWFIQGGASEDDRKKGQQLALWAIVAFVLMVSIWGIVKAISGGLFGSTNPENPPVLPKGPTAAAYEEMVSRHV